MLTATATSRTSIDLSWTVPDDNGTPITGYELERWNNVWVPDGTCRRVLAARSTILTP